MKMKMIFTSIFMIFLINLHLALSLCIDTDNGKNPFIKGVSVISTGENKYDYKMDTCKDNVLHEAFCSDDTIKTDYIKCAHLCKDGRCVAPVPCDSYGDIDGDGYITAEDANRISNFIVSNENVISEQKKRGDVNGNGKLDFNDVAILYSYLKGSINTFPVCEISSGWTKFENDIDSCIKPGRCITNDNIAKATVENGIAIVDSGSTGYCGEGGLVKTLTLPENAKYLIFKASAFKDKWGKYSGIKINDEWVKRFEWKGGEMHIWVWDTYKVDISKYAGKTVNLKIVIEDLSKEWCNMGDHRVWIKVKDLKIIPTEACKGKLGDVTGDNKINFDDLNALLSVILKEKKPEDYPNIYCGDIDGNGKFNFDDIAGLLNIIQEQEQNKKRVEYKCESGQKLGDTTGDGKINFDDLTTLLSVIQSKKEVKNIYCGDIDGNKKLDFNDIAGLLNIILNQPGLEMYVIDLYKGWNQISLPVNKRVSLSDLKKDCEIKSAWRFNASKGKWEKVDELIPGEGYFLYVDEKECKLTFKGEKFQLKSLKIYKGWNLIGLGDAKLDEIIGSCEDVIKPTLWWWNTKEGKWEKSKISELGKGYYVYSQGDCEFRGVTGQ